MPNVRWPFVPAVLATAAAAWLLWQWLGRPVDLPDVPGGRLQCLSYTPYTPGEIAPDGPSIATAGRIAEDLRRLAPLTDCIRIYTATGNGRKIAEAARAAGMHVLAGAWIGSDRERNALEVDAALALAIDFPGTVTALVAGNEVLLRRELGPEELASLILDTRARSPVPVAYADVAHFVQDNPGVARAANFVMIHILPYWDDPRPQDPSRMQSQVEQTLADVRNALPGVPVMIGEAGYPSAGRQRGPARATRVEEARFVRTFAARAPALGVRYNLIEAIDQPWKRRPEGTVGGYWGLLDEHREPKFPLRGPVSEWPQWRMLAAAHALLAALVLATGLQGGLPRRGWLLLGVFGFVAGLAGVFQYDFALATCRSVAGWFGAAGAALLALASVAVVRPVAAGRTPAQASPLHPARGWFPPRTVPARIAGFALAAAFPAAWIGLTLAFAPRYEDVPLAWFAPPALALAIRFAATGWYAAPAAGRREEAMLAAVLLASGLGQLEPGNGETAAWAVISALLALPWLPALGRMLRPGPGAAPDYVRPPDGGRDAAAIRRE